MSAATPSTASSTSCTSPSPTPAADPPLQGEAAKRWAAALGDDHAPATDDPPGSRFAWCVTGSGHYLEESMALAARLPNVDLFLSGAADEVLPLYGMRLELLRERYRVFRDKSASSVPVGRLYAEAYHTVVIAPATSNTVAKCAFGLSDTLPTNMFAQAGKLGVPSLVFACDTEPVVITKAPRSHATEWLTLRPRGIELENVERLKRIDHCQVLSSPAELEAALDARLKALKLAWNTSSS
ncbi:dihydromethanopterin reductase [Methylibium sp. Pch-M]|jgi:flavoprotein|uniref:flavoprotein n=1 Tax=unclassified Methylibium TaxID=2633235 RepID=UPI0009DD328E|nr:MULTISPECIES: flavoprotein [Methylibium]QAZ40641.1 dihydromethanopterin reductase [Methylibium sp. Pch-M]